MVLLILVAAALVAAITAEGSPPSDEPHSIYYVQTADGSLSVAVNGTDGTVTALNSSRGFSRNGLAGSALLGDDGEGAEVLAVNVTRGCSDIPATADADAVCVHRKLRVRGYGTAAGQSFAAETTEVFWADSSTVPGVPAVGWELVVRSAEPQPWRTAIAVSLPLAPAPSPAPAPAPTPGHGTRWWFPSQALGDVNVFDPLAMRGELDPPAAASLGVSNYLYGVEGTNQAFETMPVPLAVFADATTADGGGGGVALVFALKQESTGASDGMAHNDANDEAETFAAALHMSARGALYRRYFNRLGNDTGVTGVRFTQHLVSVAGESDAWREALGWAAAAAPRVFTPVSTDSAALRGVSGMGMYTCASASALNTSALHTFGASTLWDAHFWWPYIGMMLPPQPATPRTLHQGDISQGASNTHTKQSDPSEQRWVSNLGVGEQTRCDGGGTGFKHGAIVSRKDILAHYRAVRNVTGSNTTVLAYFNLFEFGQDVRWPLPPPTATQAPPAPQAPLWNVSSSAYLSQHLADALISTPPSYTWQSAIDLDPGVASFRIFLRQQAQAKVAAFGPDFRGVVVDRTDHTTMYSKRRDDEDARLGSRSWCGATCASMLPAWKRAAADLSAVVHGGSNGGSNNSRVVLINFNGGTRADLLRHADGIFSESGDTIFNAIGLATAATAMPRIAWTYSLPREGAKWPSDRHAYMQRLLYVGVQPMAPVAGADHSILAGDASVEAVYAAYGPLFRALRGARWLLRGAGGNAVTVLPATAAAASVGATRANALLGPDGALLVAIVMGGILNETRVALSAALASQFVVSACSVAHAVATRDAQPQWAGRPWQARARGNGTGVVLGVPLQHGCALLRCEKK